MIIGRVNTTVIFLSILFFFSTATAPLLAKQKTVAGIVFDDADQNGIFSVGEKGIPGIVVSNQTEAVKTDAEGRFRLPVTNQAVFFVSKPAGYDVPLDENNLPRFYYIHHPKGSPPGLKYKGIEPTGKLPKGLAFPLHKSAEQENFSVIFMGDPQTRTRQEIAYFRDDVVSGLLGNGARFYIDLGDIMYDDLALYPQMNNLLGRIGVPVYHTPGNHDINAAAADFQAEAETFKGVFGPDYYSFNYGKVHFVVLNTVHYKGWNQKEKTKGAYTGYIHERQLTWLKNDLALVPQDHLVVLSMHIPLFTRVEPTDSTVVTNRAQLFEILESRRHLLAIAGHMHNIEYLEFTREDGWQGSAPFSQLIAGAGCGAWWYGPKSPQGIPLGLCTDGAPNGSFLLQFNGNSYHYTFQPANPSYNRQMRINFPSGSVSDDQLKNRYINVNVFAGTARTKVTYQLDNQPEQPMTRNIMEDPLVEELISNNPDHYIHWVEPVCSTHIWIAPLPENLEPGLHRLKIKVEDHQGDVFHGYRIFNLLPIAPIAP